MEKKEGKTMESEYETSKKRDVIIYAELNHTADTLLLNGVENPRGSAHQFRASIVFRAFTLEAFFNHVGDKVFKKWSDIDKASPLGKIEIFCSKFNISFDFGARPWQTATLLFRTRNSLAHGRDEVVKETKFSSEPEDINSFADLFARTDWEKYCTRENAERAKEDVKNMATIIGTAAGLTEAELFRFGFQVRSQSVTVKL